MIKTNLGLVEYAKAQLGKPYWYGTFGNTATQSLLSAKAKQYPSHYREARIPQYRSQFGERVHDCVGLIKGYLWSETPTSKPKYNAAQDVSANGMYSVCKEKGKINTLPEIPGTLVFMPCHVGIYIGGGKVIEARGFNFGVVKTDLKSRGWQTWGKCPWISYVSENSSEYFQKCRTTPFQSLTHSKLWAKTAVFLSDEKLLLPTGYRIIRAHPKKTYACSRFCGAGFL